MTYLVQVIQANPTVWTNNQCIVLSRTMELQLHEETKKVVSPRTAAPQ